MAMYGFVLWCLLVTVSHADTQYKWREEVYKGMPIDHFSSNHTGTFNMRYLINDTWWNPNGGPIFFYPSNEGNVEEFAVATGIMWEWAPQFGAMLVFAEHRFYGKSLPYGNLSLETQNRETMNVDQAMEDFAVFLNWLKKNVSGAENSQVIAFGGSYGGMLAAWMRLKYPSVISGAIASSAPIRQLIGGDTPCWSYAERVTHTYAQTDPKCVDAIQQSWEVIKAMRERPDGRRLVQETFHICNDTPMYISSLMGKINNAWQYMAMYDYPYSANFIQPMPAWPVKEACKQITSPATNNETILLNLYKAISVYYNYTGTLKCLSLSSAGYSDNDKNWIWQTCTEIAWRNCYNETDILLDVPWDEKSYGDRCYEGIEAKLRGDFLTQKYGLQKLRTSSHIIFVNGELDPWCSSGISQENLAGADSSLVAINIPNAAHHYDLRATNPNDTQEVTNARKKMKGIVSGWLAKSDDHSNKGATYNSPLFLTVTAIIWCLFHC